MLAVAQESQEPKKAITKPDRLFHEINLLHLEGHYFTFDPKAARVTRDPLKEIDERWRDPERNTVEPVSITPNSSYGTPSVFAYKVFQAIIKKLSDYGYPAPENVSFGHRENHAPYRPELRSSLLITSRPRGTGVRRPPRSSGR